MFRGILALALMGTLSLASCAHRHHHDHGSCESKCGCEKSCHGDHKEHKEHGHSCKAGGEAKAEQKPAPVEEAKPAKKK